MWCHCCILMLILIAFGVIFGLFHSYLMVSLTNINDVSKCPYCYGKTFCDNIDDVSLDNSVFGRIIDWFNVKNVYYGDLENVDVVIKKLASDSELDHFDSVLCSALSESKHCNISAVVDIRDYKQVIIHTLSERTLLQSFQVCTPQAAKDLFDDILALRKDDVDLEDYLKNVWTTLEINVEPLILQLLKSEDNWPFPKYYGSCGRLIVEEHRGMTLLDSDDLDWLDRAYLAVQLLHAAKNLTYDHPKYRFYLTDISPDNMAIDDKLKLTFVDLENIVVQEKNRSDFHKLHKSENIHDSDGFAFSVQEICEHELSDHNYYAICKLILSKNAPYPMTKYGLLNTPPRYIVLDYPQLFDLIEDCSVSENGNRVNTAQKILDILNEILHKYKTIDSH